jgi:hypothetical protein
LQYFKHFTKMRSDTKIRRLFAKYGIEGYGLYNLILESIAESIETESPLPFLEETCDDIATFYNGNSAKIDEMVRYMIQEGLVTVETTQNRIACYKIYKYLEQSQTRSDKIRELIAAYKDSRDIVDGQKCLGLSETKVIEENRIDKEKNKTKKRKTASFIPPTPEDVEEYILEKEYCVDPIKFFKWYDPEWVDREGKPIQNWKNKVKRWDSSEREKNPAAVPYSKPKPPEEYRPKPCPKCGGEMRGGGCTVCFSQFDAEGNEI